MALQEALSVNSALVLAIEPSVYKLRHEIALFMFHKRPNSTLG
ncbi:hypothetical protein D035_1972 [Vibrio parahaemolyticus VP250]|nr:hypothetical protein D035_1972 [Vibrio parahaemolyticus VP250]